jgi:hypothetical protein
MPQHETTLRKPPHLPFSVLLKNLQWTQVPLLGQIMGVPTVLFSPFGGHTRCDRLLFYLHWSF